MLTPAAMIRPFSSNRTMSGSSVPPTRRWAVARTTDWLSTLTGEAGFFRGLGLTFWFSNTEGLGRGRPPTALEPGTRRGVCLRLNQLIGDH